MKASNRTATARCAKVAAGARLTPCRGPRLPFGRTAARRGGVARVVLEPTTAPAADAAPKTSVPSGGDPWEDEKWTKYKWTIYRGVAYDLTSYLGQHPGGRWLLNLAVGRDATALFESYHLRPEVAAARLKRLPVLEGFPVDAVPRSPRPNDSELYNTIRERVRKEVFKGTEVKGAHRSGSEGAALAVLGYAAAAYALYTYDANPLTGALLGLSGAWIGLTIQHCGNHGAMSTIPLVNNLLGLTNDLAGGSSLMWRYHHQVSHHIHCNDDALDEDVFSAFPILRFDDRLPGFWYHRWQHIYMWALFPFLQLVFQSIVLAATFAVSHNVPETKPLDAGPTQAALDQVSNERDWGVQQVLTSANWGGVVGNFFTGGLNLQVVA
ncbi:putative Delta(5) fatty acid desaturase C [Tetrabaena socialis]|uniref:Putative Delta(5) fatty acid desaturase C n=1 Tax=Tetrabaena socialis TaxID=47790 RepID=A0A2J8A5P9_9CHLO|nr:putative Delta(5) fatty acid desaturase C [Tetrabaena socialis]|eukprot:PNH07823.1 putative Delta(5) fatty acid desaturase C [Tetrabaena socialis]